MPAPPLPPRAELTRRIRRYTVAKLNCLVIKYDKDRRYSAEHMSTHDKTMLDALPCADLSEVPPERLDGVDVIGIDEGQFFAGLNTFCEAQANEGRIVIVAALDGTFQRQAFGGVCDLVPLAEKVDKLTAVCKVCAADAAFSKRMSADTAIEVIGGGELYWPVCRRCYFSAERPSPAPMHVGARVRVATKVRGSSGGDEGAVLSPTPSPGSDGCGSDKAKEGAGARLPASSPAALTESSGSRGAADGSALKAPTAVRQQPSPIPAAVRAPAAMGGTASPPRAIPGTPQKSGKVKDSSGSPGEGDSPSSVRR